MKLVVKFSLMPADLVSDNGHVKVLKNRRKTQSFTPSTETSPKEQMAIRTLTLL